MKNKFGYMFAGFILACVLACVLACANPFEAPPTQPGEPPQKPPAQTYLEGAQKVAHVGGMFGIPYSELLSTFFGLAATGVAAYASSKAKTHAKANTEIVRGVDNGLGNMVEGLMQRLPELQKPESVDANTVKGVVEDILKTALSRAMDGPSKKIVKNVKVAEGIKSVKAA